MNLGASSQHSILVAIPDDWSDVIGKILEDNGFVVVAAHSKDEVWELATAVPWRAIVVTSDWAINNAEASSLIEIVEGRVPTVTLVRGETLQRYGQAIVFGKVYRPALHEFCTVPVDIQEFIARLHRALKVRDKK